ncbi:MAG: PEGA domain-containing protein, partial [Candidatus Cloacimonadales bacterium]|nr:PEGA domain-containing protein [Candidatus Cloacimonadales bacterium]
YEDERTSETLVMTKNYALVTVDSPGSEIFINNDKVGVDHCEVKLEKGQYQVKCSKENYHWVVETINADPAKDIYLQMDPEPMMASLNVESKPIESLGSQVWVNDEKKEATTPGAFDLVPGEYDVSVKHKYFYDKTKHISLSPNDHNIMVFEMEALKGSPIAQSIRWKRSKWTSFTTTMLLVGAGEYYNYQGELAYDDYNRANTTSDAIRLRKDCDDLLQKRDYAYSFSVVPAAWFFYSWLKQSHYQKKATE